MHVKVQTLQTAAAVLLVAALLFAGCDRTASEPPPPDPDATGDVAPVDRPFGDPYEIVLSRAPDHPDDPPVIERDTLVAQVGYPGGCEDHDFELDHETARDTVRLWLRHDAGGDDCEAYLHDEVRLPVPEAARRAETTVLLNPQGGPPFVVNRVED